MLEIDRFLKSHYPEREFPDSFEGPACHELEQRYRWIKVNGIVRNEDSYILHDAAVIARPSWGKVTIPAIVSGSSEPIDLEDQWFIIKNPNRAPIRDLGTYNGITEFGGYMLVGRVAFDGNGLVVLRPVIKEMQIQFNNWYYKVFEHMKTT